MKEWYRSQEKKEKDEGIYQNDRFHIKMYHKGPSDKIQIFTCLSRGNSKLSNDFLFVKIEQIIKKICKNQLSFLCFSLYFANLFCLYLKMFLADLEVPFDMMGYGETIKSDIKTKCYKKWMNAGVSYLNDIIYRWR